MKNIWSDNKYIELAINILLFAMGINFLHYGQLILPIICFLLFVDNKLRFRVNSPLTFIVLCLFGVSFYAFSVKDFYAVMGFTLPMAYYIGSNMKHPTGENVRKVVYILAFSMGLHVVLNSIYEYIVHGHHGFFMSTTHYDFWTREKISNTATAMNADLMLGCFYFLLFHEKDRKLVTLNLIITAVSMFYLVVIGRRTPLLLLFVAFVLSFIYETIVLKKGSEKIRKGFVTIMVTSAIVVAILVAVYLLNVFNCRVILDEYHIVQKFTKNFINDQRFELYFGSFSLMPKYLWGGQHISTILGEQVHDFWIDIYDYAGILTCAIMIVYSFIFTRDVHRFFKKRKADDDTRILFVGVLSCIIIQMFLEPVMTGASLFLLAAIIIHALFERLIKDEQ